MISDRDFLCSTLAKIDRFPVSFEIESFEERVSIRIDSGSSVFDARLDAFHDLFVAQPSMRVCALARARVVAEQQIKSPLRITSGLLYRGGNYQSKTHSFL